MAIEADFPPVIIQEQQRLPEQPQKNPIEKAFFEAVDYVEEGFKNTCKGLKVAKATTGVIEEFSNLPDIISDIFKWTKPFKIIKGGLACKKAVSATQKIISSTDPIDKAWAGWALVKSIKKIVGAIETIGKYLKDFNLIGKEMLRWTEVTGYIFMPITYISTGIAAYDFHKINSLMNDFRANTKVKKGDIVDENRLEAMKKAIRYVNKEYKAIQKAKVISKECNIKDRTQRILDRLISENGRDQEEAFKEGSMVLKRLKDRLASHVVSSGIGASLSTLACASSTFALAMPAATAPVAIIDLVCVLAGTANYALSKFIPDGDIFEEEQPMFYAHVFKELNRAGKQLSSALEGVTSIVQEQFHQAQEQLAGAILSH